MDWSDATIEIATDASIKDKAENIVADPVEPSLTATAEVDTDGPTVKTVAVAAMDGDTNGTLNEKDGQYYYGAGDKIRITVTMSEKNNIVVENATLALGIGSASRLAKYTDGRNRPTSDDAATLAFEYRVASVDEDVNGISIAKGALRGTIKDSAGNAANLDLGTQAKSDLGDHPVFGSLNAFVPLDKTTTDPTAPAPAPISSISVAKLPSGYRWLLGSGGVRDVHRNLQG